jgi:hypothetical protein
VRSFQFLEVINGTLPLFIWNCLHLPHPCDLACICFHHWNGTHSHVVFYFYFDTLFSVICNLESYRYYTGHPKDLGPSRIIPFTSERQFVQLLHEGRPVVVAFTIKYIPIL